MPFYNNDKCEEPAQVTLKTAGHKTFQITSSFWYQYPDGFTTKYRDGATGVQIRAHEGKSTTDLASVPSFLWGVLASYGPQLLPSLLHDQRCEDVRAAKARGEDGLFQMRSRADYEFRKALADVKVGRVRRRVFWTGVAMAKYLGYGRIRAVPLAAHIGVGVAALTGLVSSMFGTHWFGWETGDFGIVLGLTLIASVAWWRDWSLPIVAILAGPLLGAVIVFTYCVMFVVFFADGVVQTPAAIKKIWKAAIRTLRGTAAPITESPAA